MKKNCAFTTLVLVLFVSLFKISGLCKEKKVTYQQNQVNSRCQRLNVNQLGMWILNNGSFCRNYQTGKAGLEYPRGSGKYAVYAAGLWITGKINGNVRTACADYNSEYQGGVILSNGQPDDPSLEKYRLYKIKSEDSADPGNPNYNQDYAEWPVADGAPLDNLGNPLILGDQTIWFVMNDANTSLHDGAYNTSPLKIEVQVLAWAFDENATPLGKTVFLQYTIINKNNETIEDAYIGLFVDADLGDANDDRTASDTTLNLSYNYNGKGVDAVYGTAVPAVGFCLLQGPAVPTVGQQAFQFLQKPIQNAQLLNITSHTVYY